MKFLLRRLLFSIFVVFCVVTLAFVINNVIPGDPAKLIAGPQARPADVARVRAELQLDRPLAEQYGKFMRRLVHFGGEVANGLPADHKNCASVVPVLPKASGAIWLHLDFGRSFGFRQPVVKLIGDRFPRSLALALCASVIELALGIFAGSLAAAKRNSIFDHGAVGISLIGISAPTFLFGLLLQFVFAYKLRLLPLDGFGTTFAEHARSIVLPACTLGLFGAGYYTRIVRDEMITQLREDYVRTAWAKGAGGFSRTVRHALRNTLIPVATIVALQFGGLVGGAIVTESIFRWPGIGQLSVQALVNRDGPVIVGTVIVTSSLIVLSNVLVDLVYAVLDPRVRTD